jgi:DNA-binding response OmpR family regulator
MTKILLVEYDVNLRDIYFARFQADNYELAVASNGEEALAIAVKEKPDLILLDVMMPRISGFDVLDILRSTPETKSTKVIMMTALSEQTDKDRGKALGVDEYLVKSQVTLEDVVATVKKVLGSSAQASPKPEQPTTPPTPAAQ